MKFLVQAREILSYNFSSVSTYVIGVWTQGTWSLERLERKVEGHSVGSLGGHNFYQA